MSSSSKSQPPSTKKRKIEDFFRRSTDKTDSSDGESADAFIPGVSLPGNRRPSRLKARKTREIKVAVPSRRQVHSEMLSDSAGSKSISYCSTTDQSFAERSIRRLQKASLKDLRPEDKKRIADLIKELARVGEEREKAVHELHGERENFEKQLLTLVDQQEKILQEREDIQGKLFQCQQLLTEYQAQILNKQDILNTSIAGLKLAIGKPVMTASPRKDSADPRRSVFSRSNETEYLKPRIINLQRKQSQERNSTPTNRRADHEILTETKDPSEGIKRPYTSLIDKEIARERSLSRSSRGSLRSRSRSVSPGNGRPKFAYPDNLAGIGPLHEPVASSTHKSLEIRAQMSNNLDPDSPRSSLRGSSIRGQSPVELEKHSKGHVAFNDRTETNEEAELYSPNIGKSRNIKDPEYAGYYKNLTSSGRKKELLKQRQVLLDEQERLRVVLKEQEDQLKRKHLEYEKRKQLQKERMEFYEKSDKFPPLKLNFDADSEKGFESDTEKPGVVLQRLGRNGEVRIDMYTPPPPEVVQIDDSVKIKSRISAATSPLRSSQQEKVSMATSPLHTPRSQESDLDTAPGRIDVATSISYRSPLKDAGNRQGNLPLHANRQRSSPAMKEMPATSPRTETHTTGRKLGEKTLNVLDLVNSMEEPPSPYNINYIENRENNFEPAQITPDRHRTSLKSTENKSSPYRMRHSPAINRPKPRIVGNDDEESLEENKILEDIFFL